MSSAALLQRPAPTEAATYYFTYIDQVPDGDLLSILRNQLPQLEQVAAHFTEETSQRHPAPNKWSPREILNHISDAERLFAFRAFWFARGLKEPLPSFDQQIAAAHTPANELPWTTLIEEFRAVRQATLSLLENLPTAAWTRTGTASDLPFSVRALAFIIAGHFAHHINALAKLRADAA